MFQHDSAEIDQVDVDAWLRALRTLLPAGTLEQVGAEERVALLDLARIAALRN